jgi:hypothetical protein
MKSDGKWKGVLEKQDIKIELKKERVTVKKRKDDYVFMTPDTSSMEPKTKAWYMEERATTLQRRDHWSTTVPTQAPTSTIERPCSMA